MECINNNGVSIDISLISSWDWNNGVYKLTKWCPVAIRAIFFITGCIMQHGLQDKCTVMAIRNK